MFIKYIYGVSHSQFDSREIVNEYLRGTALTQSSWSGRKEQLQNQGYNWWKSEASRASQRRTGSTLPLPSAYRFAITRIGIVLSTKLTLSSVRQADADRQTQVDRVNSPVEIKANEYNNPTNYMNKLFVSVFYECFVLAVVTGRLILRREGVDPMCRRDPLRN